METKTVRLHDEATGLTLYLAHNGGRWCVASHVMVEKPRKAPQSFRATSETLQRLFESWLGAFDAAEYTERLGSEGDEDNLRGLAVRFADGRWYEVNVKPVATLDRDFFEQEYQARRSGSR